MPYFLSNSRYLIIGLLSLFFIGFLLFFGSGTLLSREGNDKINEKTESEPEHQPDEGSQVTQPPLIYINSLPALKLTLQQQRQSILDTGTKMLQAESDYLESLTDILVTLANYYSPKQFGDQTPQEFISEVIESRF